MFRLFLILFYFLILLNIYFDFIYIYKLINIIQTNHTKYKKQSVLNIQNKTL
jgi:hypothetical protein